MISLPNLLKRREQEDKVQDYTFHKEYEEALIRARLKKKMLEEEPSSSDISEEEIEPEEPFLISKAEQAEWKKKIEKERQAVKEEAKRLLEEATKQADALLAKAKEEAEQIREEAQKEGYDTGYAKGEEEGYQVAYTKVEETVGAETEAFLQDLKRLTQEVAQQKQDILYQYQNDLKDVAVAVAEKVVQVSLKSSGEIIERMIISATERLKTKEWVKIYVSKSDAQMMLEADKDLVASLSHLSEHIKVIVMNNEKQGTCIIECPDEIIDASVNTQMENIKEILNQSGT